MGFSVPSPVGEVKGDVNIMVCPDCGKRMPCMDSAEVLPNVRHRRYKCKSCNIWVYTAEKIYAKKECFGKYAVRRSEADANDG